MATEGAWVPRQKSPPDGIVDGGGGGESEPLIKEGAGIDHRRSWRRTSHGIASTRRSLANNSADPQGGKEIKPIFPDPSSVIVEATDPFASPTLESTAPQTRRSISPLRVQQEGGCDAATVTPRSETESTSRRMRSRNTSNNPSTLGPLMPNSISVPDTPPGHPLGLCIPPSLLLSRPIRNPALYHRITVSDTTGTYLPITKDFPLSAHGNPALHLYLNSPVGSPFIRPSSAIVDSVRAANAAFQDTSSTRDAKESQVYFRYHTLIYSPSHYSTSCSLLP